MNPIFENKIKNRCDKICEFLKTNFPRDHYLITSDPLIREAAIDVCVDNFVTPETINKNFKYFPWSEKIREKFYEKYGMNFH